MTEPEEAAAALEKGFGSFRARSRSPRRPKAVWPEVPPDFFKDIVGLIGVKDGHGLLLEEAFPIDIYPMPREHVLGARKSRRFRREVQAWGPPAPPKRRYFRVAASGKVEQESSWQVAATAAAMEVGQAQEITPKDTMGPPDFLPLLTVAAQLKAPSWAASIRSARLTALRARCQQAPGDAGNWLDFAEFQWSQWGEELEAPGKQVREKQRAVLEAALAKQSGPPDVRLIRALATAEGDGTANMPVQDWKRLRDRKEILSCRRQRLLQCSQPEVSEELVWGFLEVCMLGGAGHKDGTLLEGAPLVAGVPAPEAEPAPVQSFRRAVTETLAFLAVRKVAAGHDGQAIAALERAELACISCLAFAEAASGRSTKALELLRGLATLNAFLHEGDPAFFASVWKARCRLGARGALRALQQLGAVQGQQLPEALQPLAQTLDALEDPFDPIEKPPHGHLCALLRVGGGRLRNWCADELQRSMGLNTLGVPEPEVTFEELQPFLVSFRTEEARKESVLRFLDFLGAPTLCRHPRSSKYRQSFIEAFAPLSLRSHESQVPPHGMLPACSNREVMKTHIALQSLAVWPRETLLHEVLVESLRQLSAKEALGEQAAKLPRRVLRASEDPRLYFVYAHGLWQSGARDDTRAVLLKLCTTADGVDARLMMAWWHLELSAACLARAQRLVLGLAFGCLDAGVLSGAPLDSREAGLRRLQALTRLQQLLPHRSQTDGALRYLLSSYQAVVLAMCSLLAQASARKALDFFQKQVPGSASDRVRAMSMDAGPLRPTASSRASLMESIGWARAAEQLLKLLSAAQTPPKIRLEAIRMSLRLDPGSPFALRHLTELRLSQGLANTLRRELDEVLGLHRPTPLGASAAQWLDSFRVALHAETGLPGSAARRSGLCERALALASPVATGSIWSFYGLILLLKLHREGRGSAELWRASVRATSRVPLRKVLWLLHLAACEARADGDTPEEEVIDLVEAIESKEIFLHGDPLEAIA
ncbi:unnamed protein product [Durusdinium trenchii]|uniref:Uncharacterized protein n=1 Tax=Durusdinium trenchii TaxID=1381693 RepID=A0ABP0MIB6_9DINO